MCFILFDASAIRYSISNPVYLFSLLQPFFVFILGFPLLLHVALVFILAFFFNFHYIIIESHTPLKTQKGNKFRVSDVHMVYAFSDARIRFSVKSPFGLDINFD